MTFEDWRKNVFRRIKALYFISKSVQEDITANGKKGNAFVVSVTDMGGTFGVDEFTANNPIGGGVAGLTKSLNKEFNQEKKEVLVKVIDLPSKSIFSSKVHSYTFIILILLGSASSIASWMFSYHKSWVTL